MNASTEILGGLHCAVIDYLPPGKSPRLVVVLCHGFGAPGRDLVPLAPELLNINPKLAGSVRFIFPEAPLSLDDVGMYGGRAWWNLDLARFQESILTGQFRNLRNDTPAGLPEARQMLLDLIEEVRSQTRLTTSDIVLCGFSQGSMLSTDVALRLPTPPAGVCVFSGTLLCEQEWRELAAARGPLRVLQSHGWQDPILPFEGAEWLRDLLLEAGMEVEFLPFQGAHTIPQQAMTRFAAMLDGLAAQRA